ncbi:PEP-CTERM sorting domain-containing protein [Tolypothrix sp. FACHB-123]|uniref:PEP-CTERM sorting domain-containing protein n=1 Tax=Tolypothrix sp. FACHB-123 TaxID=2692868 RepID=UPI001687A87C|nr:PEP-CTERM sorting domain-containing protein [Tolypothrix sp. FACHB-123]MBD2356659.1 PEP-CTERM sorting domain-containing protein [Tolypothrix sp. FACHB-123]
MKKILATVVSSSILAVGMLAASAPAKAATFACSSVISDNVSNTSGCQVSNTANQDFLNGSSLTVNSEKFFGLNDWVFGGKIGENSGYTGTKSGQSGSWNISSVVKNSWEDVMLIFKSGQGTNLVGYMVQDGKTFGTWNSPFEKTVTTIDKKGKEVIKTEIKDVSHISVYYRLGASTKTPKYVPEPGTILGLMAVGMGGLLTKKNSKNSPKEQATAKVTV